jgi:hypothetical protein
MILIIVHNLETAERSPWATLFTEATLTRPLLLRSLARRLIINLEDTESVHQRVDTSPRLHRSDSVLKSSIGGPYLILVLPAVQGSHIGYPIASTFLLGRRGR